MDAPVPELWPSACKIDPMETVHCVCGWSGRDLLRWRMPNEAPVRDLARGVLQAGTLPRRDPDRTWGGKGVGLPCTVCGEPSRRPRRSTSWSSATTARTPAGTGSTCTCGASPRGRYARPAVMEGSYH